MQDDKIKINLLSSPPYVVVLLAGHFLLRELLIEKMVETASQTGIEGRIINLSSLTHSWVKKDHFSLSKMINPKRLIFTF